MTHSNSRPTEVGSAAAISRTSVKKSVEDSPELKRQADEITDKILSRLRDSVHAAALFALREQKSESTAKIWLERRVFRPAQQICERAKQAKKPSLPPPSTRGPGSPSDSTGTWQKAPPSSPAPRASIPPPSSQRQEEEDEARSALRRVLARPDRASIPPPKRPTPPPPGSHSKAAPNTSELLPSRGPESREGIHRLSQKLSALGYLETPQEQATFLLDLLREITPAKSILLHTIDPRTQEGTIVGAESTQASSLAGLHTPPQDPLLTQVRRLRRAVKILAPLGDERIGKGRWALCPPETYLVALPVLHEHKLLGLVELADPVSAPRLTQEQLDAILEISRAWGARLHPS